MRRVTTKVYFFGLCRKLFLMNEVIVFALHANICVSDLL